MSGLKLVWSELLSIVNNPNSYNNLQQQNDAHHRRSNADLENPLESCETYLMRVLTNPLSLKQLSRIVIRNRLIDNMKNSEFTRNYVLSNSKYQLNNALEFNGPTISTLNANATMTPTRRARHTHSILECLIWQLDLPITLHFYLYAFPDVPPTPEDMTVFVND